VRHGDLAKAGSHYTAAKRVNSRATKYERNSSKADDELTVNAGASINDLAKRFKRGINTIEIAYGAGAQRVGTEVVVNVQF
jgi:hypothetical protein